MRLLLRLALAGLCLPFAQGQDTYTVPPEPVLSLATAAPTPGIELSPDGRWMLLTERNAQAPLAELRRTMLRLAGRRLDPAAHASFATGFVRGLQLRPLTEDTPKRVPLPGNARLSWLSWSPNSEAAAYVLESRAGSELWVVEALDPTNPKRLTDRLTTIPGTPRWNADGSALLVHLWPTDMGPEPVRETVPTGPVVLETDGEATPLRTTQDLLRDGEDARLWAYHSSSEVAILGVDGSDPEVIARGIFADADLSPDGRYLMVAHYDEPYSYSMPAWQFGRHVRLVDLQDRARPMPGWGIPLPSAVPIGGVPTGPRSFQWAASHAASLVWVEALDGGDPEAEVAHRDRWLMLQAPFAGKRPAGTRAELEGATPIWEPTEMLRTEHRAIGLNWFLRPGRVLATEYDRERRWRRSTLHSIDTDAPAVVLEDRSARDAYGDPGRILRVMGPLGREIVQVEDDHLLRSGRGSSDKGDLPFLDRQHLISGKTERVWRSAEGSYESVLHALGVRAPDGSLELRFVTRHESKESAPNLRLRSEGSEEFLPITSFPDPQPELRGVSKAIVRYPRADGVPLSATLYLPADHEPGERLPVVVWGYPLEYSDDATAGQVRGSDARFTRVRGTSHLFLTTLGYAVLDGATMPVIGDAKTMNDTFVEQLVASAEAAVNFLVDDGIADPERIAIAGHSYGAFMTANLLAHSDLFRCGIARSGAYNRTLTPFGFQSEQRNLWEATEAYLRVSPFLAADQIDEPLLLIHGALDNNAGTYPMQSERLFHALQGLGGTARLVMLPGEGHGYRARESVLHTLAEMASWLDLHMGVGEVQMDRAPVEAVAPKDE